MQSKTDLNARPSCLCHCLALWFGTNRSLSQGSVSASYNESSDTDLCSWAD